MTTIYFLPLRRFPRNLPSSSLSPPSPRAARSGPGAADSPSRSNVLRGGGGSHTARSSGRGRRGSSCLHRRGFGEPPSAGEGVGEEFLALGSRVGCGLPVPIIATVQQDVPQNPRKLGFLRSGLLTQSLLHLQIKWDRGFGDTTLKAISQRRGQPPAGHTLPHASALDRWWSARSRWRVGSALWDRCRPGRSSRHTGLCFSKKQFQNTRGRMSI